MIMRKTNGRNGLRKLAKRFAAGILSVLTLLSVVVPISAAGETGASNALLSDLNRVGKDVSDKNIYLLSVSTGIQAGDAVSYLSVRYQDSTGNYHTEYVFPNDDSGKQGLELLKPFTSALYGKRTAAVTQMTGYGTQSVSPFSVFEFESLKGLSAYSTSQFVFRTLYPITKVIGIDVFLRYDPEGKVSGEWTGEDIRLYHVNTIYGVDEAGFYSFQLFVDFDGEQIARMTVPSDGVMNFSVGESDKVFHIGRDDSWEYGLDLAHENYVSDRTELVLRMDLADVLNAGIEAFSLPCGLTDKKGEAMMRYCVEAISFNMVYLDDLGRHHSVTIPFISSALGWLFLNDYEMANSDVMGILQQGDRMAFAGMFPGFRQLVRFSVSFGDGVESSSGVRSDSGGPAGGPVGKSIYLSDPAKETVRKQLKTESISIAGISIYDASQTTVTYRQDGAMLRCSVIGTPLYYFCASSYAGQEIAGGSTLQLAGDFTKVTEKNKNKIRLTPDDGTERYVVEMNTDTTPNAGTVNDITVRFCYEAMDGSEKWTDPIGLKMAVTEYLGYWEGGGSEIAYLSGVSAGGTLAFALNNTDVSCFLKMEIALGDTVEDDWQMRSMSIYRLKNGSDRQGEWLAENLKAGKYVTDRRIYRSFDTTDRALLYGNRTLINKETGTVTVTFDENGRGTAEDWDVNWDQIKESMTYNEALQDLGFTKTRQRYQVNVKVKSNSSVDLDEGCGSTNKFYFRLIFQNGSSGYVQANQQLTADGFRAGQTESFVIAVNRDYGDLKAVHVISDDSIDETNVYDKLNVEWIEVIQLSNGGVSRNWRVNDVGWIGIDFKDNGAQGTSDGQQARTEAEMARTYQFNVKGTTMNLLFAIRTGTYASGEKFTGTMTATIEYRTTAGLIEKTHIDVAEAIAGYAQRSVPDDTTQVGDINLGGKNRKMIDPSYMFREQLTDRFIVSLSNVSQINKIELHVGSDGQDVILHIEDITVYQILEDGNLYINSNGEYQRDARVTRICGSTSNEGYTIQTIYNAQTGKPVIQDRVVNFEPHTINVNTDEMEADIERVPTSDDDSLNIFVYLTKDSAADGDFKLNAAIKYQVGISDRDSQVSVNSWRADTRQNMLFIRGVNARGISSLRQIWLRSDSTLYVDYVIVQHIREGVVVNTLYFNFSDRNVNTEVSAQPSYSGRKESQTVTLQFSDDTVQTVLEEEKTDIAVAFAYTTLLDETGEVNDSPYVFLTDKQITEIRAGKAVDITFSESYVKEVKKIMIVGVGTINATVNAASVSASVTEGGVTSRTGVFSIGRQIPVTRSVSTAACTSAPVVPFTLSVSTEAQMAGTANNLTLGLEIAAIDSEGGDRVFNYDDVTPFLEAGKIFPGSTARIRLLLSDVSEIRTIRLFPHGQDGEKAEWALGSAKADWIIDNRDVSRRVDPHITVTEGEGFLINLSEFHIDAVIGSVNPEGETVFSKKVSEGSTTGMSVESGFTITVKAELSGSLEGYGLSAKAALTEGEGDYSLTENNGVLTFRPVIPENSKETSRYQITVYSEEMPSVCIVINVSVKKS